MRRRMASLRRVVLRALAIGNPLGREWRGLVGRQSLCSSREVGESGGVGNRGGLAGNAGKVGGAGDGGGLRWQRWKELPAVPLQSAVCALEEIERDNHDSSNGHDHSMKRLTALRWVAKCCPSVPHSLINKLFRLRQIRMQVLCEEVTSTTHNSTGSLKDTRLRRVSAKDVLDEGAVLCIPAAITQVVDERTSPAKETTTTHDVKWLRSLVLHKDKEIIVLNKPSGLAVQGGSGVVRSLDSLMEAALSYEYNEGPRLIHRLDKETSGALVVGRTHQSTVFLQALLKDKSARLLSRVPGEGKVNTIERCYWALVIGVPEAKGGRISAPLAKVVTGEGKLDRMRVVHESHPNAQAAITDYKVLGSSVLGCSWLELRPLTGRKHQIRVHLAEVLGLPIVGDYKYGWRALREWPPNDHTDQEFSQQSGHGHVWSSRPFLHLHCRQLTLPDVVAAFNVQTGAHRAKPSLIHVVAPLPAHMALSWNLRPLNPFPTLSHAAD